jgi:hypothetical protein
MVTRIFAELGSKDELQLALTRMQYKRIWYLTNICKILKYARNNGYEIIEMCYTIFGGYLNVMKNSSQMRSCQIIFFLMEIRNKRFTHIVVLIDDTF